MTYNIEKLFYVTTNQTRVRLYQEYPLREFEVMIDEDLTGWTDLQVEQRAKEILSLEFNPIDGLKEIQRQLTTTNTLVNTVTKTILVKNLTEEEKEEILSQYQKYEIDKEYKAGDVFFYGGTLYEVIQNHKSQEDWKPEKTKSLYKIFLTPKTTDTASGEVTEVVNEFVQPTGAHDTYKKGDKVLFNGIIYESLADNNAYSPLDYPQNWEELEKIEN